jgi:hypothetical protein
MPDKIKKIAEFNIENAKFAIKASGIYGTPIVFNHATSFGKEANSNLKDIYGDGRIVASFVSDNGLTGKLGLLAIDKEYETAMGRYLDVTGGLAEVKQLTVVPHAIYIETNVANEGQPVVLAKAWYLNVTSGKASETYSQNTDNINESNIEYPLNIRGEVLQDSTGTSDYIDPTTGKKVYVFRVIKLPSDADYETFGNSVPTVKAIA